MKNFACVRPVSLTKIGDPRGWLVPLEAGKNVPFSFKRVYCIFGTREGIVRGHHAHRALKQLLIATSGSVIVNCEWNGGKKSSYVLDSPEKGLLIEGMVWHTMADFTPDCVLTVLASDYYDEADYIRDYDIFLQEAAK